MVQKQVAVIANGAAKKASLRETKPRVEFKAKAEVIIDISSDSSEENKQRCPTKQKSSSRKKVHTMTSLLTARSKVKR